MVSKKLVESARARTRIQRWSITPLWLGGPLWIASTLLPAGPVTKAP
jgi:hypothetical protein